jgi:hypothetical protein
VTASASTPTRHPTTVWCVNTHLIELPTQVIAVDAQHTLRFVREVLAMGGESWRIIA